MERLSDAGSIPARSILEAKGNAWYAGVSLFVLLIQCSRKWRLFDRYFKKRVPLKSIHDFWAPSLISAETEGFEPSYRR